MYSIRTRDEAINSRAGFLFLIGIVGIALNSSHAADSKNLIFYPPFIVADIASIVYERQETLRASQFHTMITVQFGTRNEWNNACAWLRAQTDNARSFYTPAQEGIPENQYFCAVFETNDGAPQEPLFRMHRLITELCHQFGGAAHRWTFEFGDISGINPHTTQ